MVLILFLKSYIAPWCGHCKNLQPHWNSAATRLKGLVNFGKVDATVEKNLATRYGINGYPTIKVFFPGGDINNPTDYTGERTTDGIFNAASEYMKKYPVSKEIIQITSQEVLDQECIEKNGICVIVFLPHILDTKAEGRKKMLKIIEESAKTTLSLPYYYFWAQAYDHKQMEKALNLGMGYPAVVAISYSKKVFGTMKLAYTEPGVKEYLNALKRGHERLSSFKELPKANNVEKWDGKDAKSSEL